ncbi:tyrosine-type recombinase/integrase [Chitinilyticum litopenaei]|uniref:tyrosine-type recombinase/integrase n=1 Tax=Chitinilyticum litopenaei TaxID=1121276 RepID=UPI0003FAF5C8|nr:site-specific integrase [Chitinilyticum litopenaei]
MAAENILTEKTLKAIKPAAAGETVSDGGNLNGTVRVNRLGTVTVAFTWRYRSPESSGKLRNAGCGSWPTTSLAEIRAERNQLRDLVAKGIDPLEQRQRDLKATEAARLAEEAKAAQLAARLTFTDLFTRWDKAQLSQRKDGGTEIRRAFTRDVLPAIGAVYADEVTRQMIAALLHAIVERGSPRMANRTLSDLRQCFGYAIGGGMLEHDPTSHLKKASFGGKETERDRTLTEDELRYLLQAALPASNMSGKGKAAIRFLLATAARVGELLRAELSHFDTTARQWHIPAENSKNGESHTIWLSDFALEALTELLAIVDHPRWLYPNRDGSTHVCVKTLTKQIGDRQTDKPMRGRSKSTADLVLPGGKWTPHDLRRTAATTMAELGIAPHVVERCLNHIEPNKVARTYNRARLEGEQQAAFEMLGMRLALLSDSAASNVVTLRRA